MLFGDICNSIINLLSPNIKETLVTDEKTDNKLINWLLIGVISACIICIVIGIIGAVVYYNRKPKLVYNNTENLMQSGNPMEYSGYGVLPSSTENIYTQGPIPDYQPIFNPNAPLSQENRNAIAKSKAISPKVRPNPYSRTAKSVNDGYGVLPTENPYGDIPVQTANPYGPLPTSYIPQSNVVQVPRNPIIGSGYGTLPNRPPL